MPSAPLPLDSERLFVADWGSRTEVRAVVAPEEEDPVAAIVTHPGTTRAFAPIASARPVGRGHPSPAARRLRAAVAFVAAAAVGTLLGAGSLAGAEQASPAPAQAPVPAAAAALHVVQPGDTLWSLARRAQPEGDVRPLVARLRAAAGGGDLVPGQRIRLAV